MQSLESYFYCRRLLVQRVFASSNHRVLGALRAVQQPVVVVTTQAAPDGTVSGCATIAGQGIAVLP
jgi:hypothetical protein